MGVRMKTPPARLESGRVEPERRHAMARVVGPSTAPGTPIKSPCSCLLRSFSTQQGMSPESMATIRASCWAFGHRSGRPRCRDRGWEPTRVMAPGVHPGAIGAHWAGGATCPSCPSCPSSCRPIWSPKGGSKPSQCRPVGFDLLPPEPGPRQAGHRTRCGHRAGLNGPLRDGARQRKRGQPRYAAAGRGGASALDGQLEARSLAGEPVHLRPA